MSFAQRSGHLFDPMSKKRADQCGVELVGLVRDGSFQFAQFNIQSTDGVSTRVTIRWSTAAVEPVEVHCPCSQFGKSRACKHVWASFVALDKRGTGRELPGRNVLTIVPVPAPGELAERVVPTGAERTSSPTVSSAAANPRLATTGTVAKPVAAAKVPAEVANTATVTRTPTKPAASKPAKRPDQPMPVASSDPTPARKLPEYAHRWKNQIRAIREAHVELNRPNSVGSIRSLAARHEVWYVLDVEASHQMRLPTIALFERFQSASGAWNPPRRLLVTNQSLAQLTEVEDRELVDLILGPDGTTVNELFSVTRESLPSFLRWTPARRCAGAIARGAYEVLLPRLCGTRRFVWAASARGDINPTTLPALEWDLGPPWTYAISVVEQQLQGVWRFTGELRRGGRAVPLAGTRMLQECGLVIVGNQLSRVETGSVAAWAGVLGDGGQLVVPFEDGPELVREMWSFAGGPPVQLPPKLQWTESASPPEGRLSVHLGDGHGWKSRLAVRAEFLYEDTPIECDAAQDCVVDVANQTVVRRQPAAELDLLSKLQELDLLTRDENVVNGKRCHFVLESRKLEQFVDGASEAGWLIVADGHVLRRAGEMQVSVSSGLDWFDLTGSVDFGGESVPLPTLLAAVKKGEKYVRLGDGTRGILPRDWLDRVGRLINFGERKGDALRFQMSQTLLLDALLAAQDVQTTAVDEKFVARREKLKAFKGVSPHDPPPTFRGTLRHYQKEGLGWLHFLREFGCGGCLADDMGLGKTVQVLSLLESRRLRVRGAKEPHRPSLVVVPKSLVFNWLEEASRFVPDLRVLNYTGAERSSVREELPNYDVIITTYGVLRRDIVDLQEVDFDYAILDEAQAIKTATSQAAKACRLIRASHRLAMTGTPIENHLGELWSLCEFLNPGMLGQAKSFQALAKGAAKRAAATTGRDTHTLLAQTLRPFILRRTKSQVLSELPERTEQTLYCEMDGEQRKLYDELREYYRKSLMGKVAEAGLERSKIQILEALLRLRQVACHPALVSPDKAAIPSAKLELLIEQLTELVEENHKALVFSQFTSLLALVRKELDSRGLTYEYLDGQTQNRQACVERFQNDDNCRLFLISLKAGGQGLNLTAADYVFILDPWWNPAVEAQAVDRAYRMGQKRNVFAYRLICRDTVEEKILELQRTKRELAESIIGEENSVLRNLSAEDLQLLLS